MLKKIINGSAIALTSLVLLTGCTYKTSPDVNTVDLNKVNMNEVATMKKGEACHSWFLVFPTGTDKTIKEAAEEAKINHIKYVEHSSHFYLIGGSDCTIIYGE